MNIQMFSGHTVYVHGIGDVDIDKMSARRAESMLCVGFRKRKERKKERGKAVVELDAPVAPQWGGCKTLPPVESDFGDRIGNQEWRSICDRFNNNWKRHRRNRWRRTYIRKDNGDLVAELKH